METASFRKLWNEAQAEQDQGPGKLVPEPSIGEAHAGVDEVLTAFSGTFNEEEIVESQMARLLKKRAQAPQSNRMQRLSELSARSNGSRLFATSGVALAPPP